MKWYLVSSSTNYYVESDLYDELRFTTSRQKAMSFQSISDATKIARVLCAKYRAKDGKVLLKVVSA